MTNPSDYQIRQAKESDQELIRALVRKSRINPLNLEWRRFSVVEIGTEMIACGQIKRHRDGSKELASIAVEEDWRLRGIASALIKQLLDGITDPVWLICQIDLVGFYTRFGFVERAESEDTPKHLRRAFRTVRLFKRLIPGIGGIAVMVREPG
jgi:N-acetylglutamate synthase-like GNAT family acetyltransferase